MICEHQLEVPASCERASMTPRIERWQATTLHKQISGQFWISVAAGNATERGRQIQNLEHNTVASAVVERAWIKQRSVNYSMNGVC